jgi:hypothetical protein
MGEEKERTSAEVTRPDGPILPTINPEAEKPQAPKVNIHPALYVAYVETSPPQANSFAKR